jgi:hypothetical protein
MGLTAEETSSRGISVAHGGLLAGSLGPLDAELGTEVAGLLVQLGMVQALGRLRLLLRLRYRAGDVELLRALPAVTGCYLAA